jgi:glycerol uptake facilitator-like aquaporin
MYRNYYACMYVLITKNNHTNKVATCLSLLNCSKTSVLKTCTDTASNPKEDFGVQIIQMALVFKLQYTVCIHKHTIQPGIQ